MADPEPEVASNIPSEQETAPSDPPIDDTKAQKMVSRSQIQNLSRVLPSTQPRLHLKPITFTNK